MAPVHPRLGLPAVSTVVLTALGLAACGGNGTPPSLVGRVLTVPGRAATIDARARVAPGPTAVDVGEGGVWVADNSAGILTRLDPGTDNHPQESICAGVAREVAERHHAVRDYAAYRVTEPTGAPGLVEHRAACVTALLDGETYRTARAADAARPPTPAARPPRRRVEPDRGTGRD